ncbi:putative MFS family arabinose efflux permease [Geobacter argillaceus]|uniref:Putative MFS family arabinose efflux permease n=2 Tax=Geobacter argillaceus TaxID=345631 RepID=A0A562V5V6_9BACT|nr:putative MFS family arabinose efflux permease [Geobacter argillaceus]
MATDIDTIAVISIFFDVSLCCTSHPLKGCCQTYTSDFVKSVGLTPRDVDTQRCVCYMPVLPAYMLKEMHSSMQAAGAINGVFLAASVLFRVHTSRLEARFGVRRVLLSTSLLFALANLLYLPAASTTSVMLIRFLSGIGFALANTSIMALGARQLPISRKGEGLACMTTMVLGGGAIGPYIGLSLAHSFGYRSVFIFATLVTLLGLLIVAAVPVEEGVTVRLRFTFNDLFEVKAIPISLIALIIAAVYGGVLTFVAVFATELGLLFVAKSFFVVMASASVVSRLLTGWMYDRLGPGVAIGASVVTLAAGLLLLGGMHTTVSMLISAALVGIGYGMAVPSTQTLAIQLSPVYRSSAVTATFFTFLDGGVGLGAYLLGGGIQAFGYSAVYLALGVLNLGCLVPLYLLYGRGGEN